MKPDLNRVDLVVRATEASVAFYRALGVDIPETAIWREPTGTGTRNVLSFEVSSRAEVDRIHDERAGLGYRSSQPPYDAFWGARCAIVEDPDESPIGLVSESDPTRRGAPPDI